MAFEEFFQNKTKDDVRELVSRLEAKTSAEFVIAVRKSSDTYREADWLCGAACGFGVLLLLLFLPHSFRVEWMPLDVVLGFLAGAGATAFAPPLKRMFLTGSRMKREVTRASLVEFFQAKVSETRGRTGVLVYVSVLERQVRIVADIGVGKVAQGIAYRDAVEALDRAVSHLDEPAFLRCLERIGTIVGKALPRKANDINELADEVIA